MQQKRLVRWVASFICSSVLSPRTETCDDTADGGTANNACAIAAAEGAMEDGLPPGETGQGRDLASESTSIETTSIEITIIESTIRDLLRLLRGVRNIAPEENQWPGGIESLYGIVRFRLIPDAVIWTLPGRWQVNWNHPSPHLMYAFNEALNRNYLRDDNHPLLAIHYNEPTETDAWRPPTPAQVVPDRPSRLDARRQTSTIELTLLRLSRAQLGVILTPIHHEGTDTVFDILYPSDSEFTEFEITNHNLPRFVHEVLEILQELHERGYSIEDFDESCFFRPVGSSKVLIGGIENRLREVNCDHPICQSINAFGRFLHEKHHHSDSDPLFHDLVSEMRLSDPDEWPTPAEALDHPYCRTGTWFIACIAVINDFLQGHLSAQTEFDLLTTTVIGPNWIRLIDPDIMAESKQTSLYSSKMSDLVRFIRNKSQHPPSGDNPQSLPLLESWNRKRFDYFHRRFPNLFLHAYYFFEREQSKDIWRSQQVDDG
jgi:hypothetical protein